jgi:DNA-binding MarR family transcriptional regulator
VTGTDRNNKPASDTKQAGGAGGTPNHPRLRLDEYLSLPIRLSIAAALARVDDAEFGAVREAIEASDPVLSKQAGILEQAGYVSIRKGYVGRRPRTWLSLTDAGREALSRHLAALHALIADL